jgi:hypothetical protein
MESMQQALDETSTAPEDKDPDPIAKWFALHGTVIDTMLRNLGRLKTYVLRAPESCIAVSVLVLKAVDLVGRGATAVGLLPTITDVMYWLLMWPATWAQMAMHHNTTMVLLRLTVATLMLWAHEFTPGTLSARPAGTTSALQEIWQTVKQVKRVGLCIILPGTAMLVAVDYIAVESGATPLLTESRVATLATIAPWLLPLAAIRCSQAVVRYSRGLGVWCAALIVSSVVAAHHASTVAHRVVTVMQSPTSLLWFAWSFLTTTSLAGIAITIVAVWALVVCIAKAYPNANTGDLALGVVYVSKNYPRLCIIALATLVGAVVAGSDAQRTAVLVGGAALFYIALELHNNRELGGVLLLTTCWIAKVGVAVTLTALAIFVNVVIPIIVHKLPYLTYQDAHDLYRHFKIFSGTGTAMDYAFTFWNAMPPGPTGVKAAATTVSAAVAGGPMGALTSAITHTAAGSLLLT